MIFVQNKEKISVTEENQSAFEIKNWNKKRVAWSNENAKSWWQKETKLNKKTVSTSSDHDQQKQSVYEIKRRKWGEVFLIENWRQRVGADEYGDQEGKTA